MLSICWQDDGKSTKEDQSAAGMQSAKQKAPNFGRQSIGGSAFGWTSERPSGDETLSGLV